jgi:hypothetical protein
LGCCRRRRRRGTIREAFQERGAVAGGSSRSIEGLARFVTYRSLSLSIGGRRDLMIVFDPAIFRLPVLRRRRCAKKLQQQPEILIRDGRRGSQWGWVGGALDAAEATAYVWQTNELRFVEK